MHFLPDIGEILVVGEDGRTFRLGESWFELSSAIQGALPTNPRDPEYWATKRGLVVTAQTGSIDETWLFQYSAGVFESCATRHDSDNDGLVGCEDPDCWPYCTPHCEPGAVCDLTLPRCGDGTCDTRLESTRICPSDCGLPLALCGDFLCDTGEDIANCPGDCTP